jgi:hypothetical protein
MDQKTISLIRSTYIFAFLLSAFVYIYSVIQPELHYFSQQPAFQANKYFFNSYLSYPGGVTEYVSLFISQYFFYNWLGSIIITLTLALFLVLGYRIFKNFPKSGNAFFWMFLPVTILLALFTNYNFPYLPVLQVLLVYGALLLSTYILKAVNPKWYLYVLLAPIIYYAGGGGSFMLYSVSYLVLVIFYLGFKKSILPVIAIILITVILPYIAFKYIFSITFSKAYFEYYLNDNLLLRSYDVNNFFYAFFYSAPALLLILSLVSAIRTRKKPAFEPKSHKKKEVKKTIVQAIIAWNRKYSFVWAMILISGIIVAFVNINTSKHQNNIVKADFYCANENWDKALSTIASDPEYDIMYNYYYNRAIDNSDQYLDKYFDYPQLFGATGTFPDELNYEMFYFLYSDYYFDLGYISESQQWAFRVLSGLPYSPSILKRLVITNLILGDYKSAGKFLSILGDNLLSKDFVDQYTLLINDTTLVSANKLIMSKRALMPINLVTPFGISERFKNLLDRNIQNKRAYEHQQMNFLLNHQYGAFYQNLPQASTYYKTLPRVFEEALLIVRTTQEQDTIGYQISPETTNSFVGFSDIYAQYRQDQESAKSNLGAYKNTLFYYIMFDSPLVTKNTPVKVSENEYNH